MNYLDIDFAGDIFYEAKKLLDLNVSKQSILKKLYNDYDNEDYDIVDEIAIFGSIYYISTFFKISNTDIDNKMRNIEAKLVIINDESDIKVGNIREFFESFYIQNELLNDFLEKRVSKISEMEFRKFDTFIINNEVINFPNSPTIYYTHMKYSIKIDEKHSIGYFWISKSNDFESIEFIKHGVYKLDYLKRIYGPSNFSDNFVNNEIIVGENNNIDLYEVAVQLSKLISKKIMHFYRNIQINEPISSKLKTGEHIFIFSTKYFISSFNKLINVYL